ncbi:hypothetical protein Leryth_014706 [Lithospermum erythrorhizon]|nr:hypothetical protein Leryth_014706 [Lithospermum erythrorhizon]
MATRGSRSEKVKRIFEQFDVNRDGGLSREEIAALVVAVNPRVKFSDEQINAILDEVFRTYGEFVDGEKGLTFDGLLRTYDDGAGDVDRDFDALGLEFKAEASSGVVEEAASSSSIGASTGQPEKTGILASRGVFAAFCEVWGFEADRKGSSRLEAFDGHMAIGRSIQAYLLFKEALVSFERACELQPSDVRAHFRAGNCYYVIGKNNEGKEKFLQALAEAEVGGNQWAYLLPQIHVNLGIALEAEGMLLSACEHYREAAILCPTHFRALKLLGSALFGVGEYQAAVKALEEAIYLKNDYADAHCDLASALHAMGDDDNAVKEFQKAIDLKPGHVDALYNLGLLYMDMGRYQRASEMYTRVLGVWPNHWRAQLNKAVSLLGAGENDEAKKALKEALKMTNRIELHDAMSHLKQLQKKRLKGNGGTNGDEPFITIEPSKFKTVGEKTTSRPELATALDIRTFQRMTRVNRVDVDLIKKELNENEVPVTYSTSGTPEKSIRKASLEVILRKLLSFLKPETFIGAAKAVNQKILSALDDHGSGRVDLGMFFAILVPMCGGSVDRRKRVAYDALLWRPGNEGATQIKKRDAQRYIKLMRVIYIPSHGMSEMLEIHGETDFSTISLQEFLVMFDDPEWGFGVMSTLLKLESGDRNRHGSHICATCRYPIIGSRFKEMKSRLSLCSQCYSEGKVPPSCKQEEYGFKEYAILDLLILPIFLVHDSGLQ